jgi:predicted MPP superfamily phosphohydrolase
MYNSNYNGEKMKKTKKQFKKNYNSTPPDSIIKKSSILKISKQESFDLLKEIENIRILKGISKKSISETKSNKARVLVISDIHLGKFIEDLDTGKTLFNNSIASDRMETLTINFINLCKRTKNLDSICIVLAGDIVDGYGIYAEQSHHQCESSPVKQSLTATRLIWKMLVSVSNEFKVPIKVVAVRGNHGRLSEDSDPSANWDLVVYEQLNLLNDISNRNIKIEISETRIKNTTIANCKVHIRHESPPQSETSSAMAKFGGWSIKHGFDILITAHYHSAAFSIFNNRYIIRNGCLCGSDDLAEKISKGAKASQVSFVIKNKKVVAFNNIEVE